MWNNRNIKTFFQKVALQIAQRKLFDKLNRLCDGHILSVTSTVKKIGKFYENELTKTNQAEFITEKVIKKKRLVKRLGVKNMADVWYIRLW